jgi:hypothetical protein
LLIRLLSGTSLLLFLIFFIASLVISIQGGFRLDSASFPELLAGILPLAFSLLLLIKGNKTSKGLSFGLSLAGIVIWVVLIWVLVLITGILSGVQVSVCKSSASASSTSSASCESLGAPFHAFFAVALAFLVLLIIHEVLLGVSAFLKKNLFIALLIVSSLLTILSIALYITLDKMLPGSDLYNLSGILGSDCLSFALSYLVSFGDNEKMPSGVEGI